MDRLKPNRNPRDRSEEIIQISDGAEDQDVAGILKDVVRESRGGVKRAVRDDYREDSDSEGSDIWGMALRRRSRR